MEHLDNAKNLSRDLEQRIMEHKKISIKLYMLHRATIYTPYKYPKIPSTGQLRCPIFGKFVLAYFIGMTHLH